MRQYSVISTGSLIEDAASALGGATASEDESMMKFAQDYFRHTEQNQQAAAQEAAREASMTGNVKLAYDTLIRDAVQAYPDIGSLNPWLAVTSYVKSGSVTPETLAAKVGVTSGDAAIALNTALGQQVFVAKTVNLVNRTPTMNTQVLSPAEQVAKLRANLAAAKANNLPDAVIASLQKQYDAAVARANTLQSSVTTKFISSFADTAPTAPSGQPAAFATNPDASPATPTAMSKTKYIVGGLIILGGLFLVWRKMR